MEELTPNQARNPRGLPERLQEVREADARCISHKEEEFCKAKGHWPPLAGSLNDWHANRPCSSREKRLN